MDAKETLVFIERTKKQIHELRRQLDAAAKRQSRHEPGKKIPAELQSEIERLVAREIAEIDEEIARSTVGSAGAVTRSPAKPVHRMV